MKWFGGVLLVVVLALQYRLWMSSDGVRELARLTEAVDRQKAENDELQARNQQMVAEVSDLKAGMAAIEERARSELGMIGRNETFYQVVPARPKSMTTPSRPPERTQTAQR
jgi:cell division protein FtsB